ncbi:MULTISPECIES: T9SS type A sorting domain-containing protein [Flavobacterium]|uniref:Secretion system C-terminal sorting domain-containing protein n=1 Tax=Flavobacterium hankyongi TaxID=1176532 RepID=A0ABP8ZQP5_9FLAO|nr:T9SS type A sorting domain-containing protein [Flavobacterium sp. N1846]
MRITLLLFLLFLSETINAQHKIKFNYDSAGNQTLRSLCVNCPTSKMANDSIVKEENIITKEEIEQENLISQVKYFPNPVLEELNVNWINSQQSSLQKIDLYSLNGQFIKSFLLSKNQESISIPFNNYAEGYYNLILSFSDNNRKTIKIVKIKN